MMRQIKRRRPSLGFCTCKVYDYRFAVQIISKLQMQSFLTLHMIWIPKIKLGQCLLQRCRQTIKIQIAIITHQACSISQDSII